MTERVTARSRPARKFACPCGCRTFPGFCPSHAAFLERVRDELKGANRRAGRRQTIPGTRGIAHEHEEDE